MSSLSLTSLIERFRLKPAQIFVLGFAFVILTGALILTFPISSSAGVHTPFIDALFTATSAVCVTGLVVVDTGTYWTVFGQIIILSLIQIGGLGIMTLASLISLLIGRKISLTGRLLIQESFDTLTLAGVVRLTKYVIILTVVIETLGAIALSFKFIPIFGRSKGIYLSIFHSVSAFCNAGFDLMGNFASLTGFVEDPIVNFTIMGLIILGGLGFAVILDILGKKRFRDFMLHTKVALTTTAILIVAGFVLTLCFEWTNPGTLGPLSLQGKFLGALFNSVTPRTAGYNTLPMELLHNGTLMVIMVLMFIGGSPGSTAGGIKTTTMALIFMTILSVTKGNEDTVIYKRRVSRDATTRAMAILGIAISLVTVVITFLTITEPNATFIQIAFETFSAFGTVGLTIGLTTKLSFAGKAIISLTMFIGRLGVLTIAFAMARKQKAASLNLRYAEEKINVG